MRKSLTAVELLIIIPVFLLISINSRVKSPFWMGKYDPQYYYLLNGLNVATTGKNIGHYDNPGTPVQILNAVMIRTVFLFRQTNSDLQTDVLLYPELYLEYIAWCFTIINSILIFISGFLVMKLTGIIGYGLIFQSFALLPTVLLHGFYRNCPEPILFAASVIFSTLIFSRFIADISIGKGILTLRFNGRREITFFELETFFIVCAALAGFMMAVKIDSLLLVLIPLFFIKGIGNKAAYLFLALLFFIFFTLPIHRYYSDFFLWIKNLFIHSDYYGSGPTDIINPVLAWKNFLSILRAEPLLLSVVFFSLIFILFKINYIRDKKLKILILLVVIQLADLLIIFKHCRLHYFLPVIPLLPLNLILVFQILGLKEKARTSVIVCILILLFAGNLPVTENRFTGTPVSKCERCINIYAYGCHSVLFGLRLGDIYAKRMNAPVLEKLYGKQWFYDYWTRQLWGWQKQIPMDSLNSLHQEVFLYTNEVFLHTHGTPFRLDSVSPGKYKVLLQK